MAIVSVIRLLDDLYLFKKIQIKVLESKIILKRKYTTNIHDLSNRFRYRIFYSGGKNEFSLVLMYSSNL